MNSSNLIRVAGGHSIEDLTGKAIHEWTVLGIDKNSPPPKRTYWFCRCSCGMVRSVKGEYLRTDRSKSCGCMKHLYDLDPSDTLVISPGLRVKNMIGYSRNELTVLRFSRMYKHIPCWFCRCSCGREAEIRLDALLSDKATSCGCLNGRITRHGMPLLIIAPGKRVRDFTGHQFGELTALAYSHTNERGADVWTCQCSCGEKTLVECARFEHIDSCGCLRGYLNKNMYDWYVFRNGVKIRLRSSYEVVYAEYLIRNNIQFEYEPRIFKLASNLSYTPDFYLPVANQWVELKGYHNHHWLRCRDLFEQATGNPLTVITKDELRQYTPDGITYDKWLSQNIARYKKPYSVVESLSIK